jgi:hypothetical protein
LREQQFDDVGFGHAALAQFGDLGAHCYAQGFVFVWHGENVPTAGRFV